jgi:predicted transcriptional regulator
MRLICWDVVWDLWRLRASLSGAAAMTTDWPNIWRRRRVHLGLTQREVDQLAGLADGYVAKLECGDKTPTSPTIDAMNQALGLTIHVDVVARPIGRLK